MRTAQRKCWLTRLPQPNLRTHWQELLPELKERGIEEVLLFISDGLNGLKGIVDAISTVFPNAQYQTCLVHVTRNLSYKVRVEDRSEVCKDFKTIYQTDNKEAGPRYAGFLLFKVAKSISKSGESIKGKQLFY